MTLSFDPVADSIVRAIGWTLLHFLWQGTAVAAVFAAAFVLMRRRSANARYVAGCAAMLLMAAIPVATFQHVYDPPAPRAAAVPVAPGVSHPDRPAVVAQPAQHGIVDAAPPVAAGPSVVAVAPAPVPPAAPWRDAKMTWQQRLDGALPWCVAVWGAGVLVLSARLFGGWLQLQRIRRRQTKPAPAKWTGRLASLARRVGVRRAVRLLECARVECPAVVGWIRPVILLPASAMSGLSVAQLESILAHELAHVRRHDYLVNLLQSAIETLLFYHPAVWWVSRRVRQERENACDDVAALVHGSRLTYAEALANLETLRPPRSSLALAASGSGILPRVRRLLGRPVEDTSRSAWWPLAGLLTVVVATVVAVRTVPTTASDKAPPPDEQARIEHHLQTLRTMRVFTNNDGWVGAIKALAEIGKPAVPALLKELETSDRAHTQAAIALTLRAIGDRRAVPGLIHALARCRVHVSDYGISVDDPALRMWMQDHQKDGGGGGDDPNSVNFGRPVNEITRSLVHLTGHTEHFAHIIGFNYDDDDTLDARQAHGSERERRLIARVADRYRTWWDANRATLLSPDEAAWVDAHAPREHLLEAKNAPRTLDLAVVGPDGQPVASADVEAWVERDRYALRTDGAGRAGVPLPAAAPKRVTVIARKSGFVPMMAWWVKETSPAPSRYTLKLRAGGPKLGGVVRDDAGAPVAGATVYLSAPHRFDEVERAALIEQPVTTDPQGSFFFSNVPTDATKVLVRVVADGHAADTHYGARKPQPTIEALRAGSAELKVGRLRDVSGFVRGPDGLPLPGATVGATGPQAWRDSPASAQTDAAGRFTIPGRRSGKLTITAAAPGMTPATTQPSAGAEVELQLRPARTVRGRVLDEAGTPLAGALVRAPAPYPAKPLQRSTDADGRFEWTDAPADAVAVTIEKVGYNSLVHAFAADQSDATVTLETVLTIAGRIVDDATGQPLATAKVVPGVLWDNDQPVLYRGDPRTATGGRYEIAFPRPARAQREPPRPRFVRIEADGYAPVTSRMFQPDEGHQTLDVRLARSAGTPGLAIAPDGSPLAGADVIVTTALQPARVYNGRNHDAVADNNQAVRSDDAGRFTVPPTGEPFVVAIVHERGFATASEADLKRDPAVKLQPWGRVEGLVIKDGKPLVEKGVSLTVSPYRVIEPGVPNVQHQFHGRTDLQGRFTFDRVPAGTYRAGSQVPLSATVSTSSPGVPVRVESGQTVTVQLGGEGSRSVVGKLALPPDAADERFDWSVTRVKLLAGGDGVTPATQPAAGAPRTAQPQADGTFRFEAVPAGSYEVAGDFSLPPREQNGQTRVRVGELRARFEVPGGAGDAPLDIGPVTGSVRSPLEVGHVAPPVRAKTVDGKPLDLADHKGKYVLVDFWATWCGPCIGETPNLKAVWDRFGKDARFAMIGLSLDGNAAAPKEYAENNQLGWTQGFLGEWSSTSVPRDWGVDGIPAIFLIGPDGKIIAKNLRGEKIAAAVAAALMADQPPLSAQAEVEPAPAATKPAADDRTTSNALQGAMRNSGDEAERILQRRDKAKREEKLAELLDRLRRSPSLDDLAVLARLGDVPFDRKPFLAELRKALGHEQAPVRAAALYAITALRGEPSDLPAIAALAHDLDPGVRTLVPGALWACGGDTNTAVTWPVIETLLDDESKWVREATIKSLGGHAVSPPAEQKLIELSHDREHGHDANYYALSTRPIISRAVAERLIEVMGAGNADEAGRAAWGMAHHAVAPDAAELVVEAFGRTLKESPHPYARENAIWGLGAIGGAKAIEALHAVAAAEKNEKIREAALEALQRARQNAAIPAAAAETPETAPATVDGSAVLPEDLVPRGLSTLIGPGDLLNISIRDLVGAGAETVKSQRVDAAGGITLPYMGAPLKAEGMTEAQLQERITQAYESAKIAMDLPVSVGIAESASQVFGALGDVNRGGRYPIQRADFRLLDALATAGGLKDGVTRVHVVRRPDAKHKAGRTIAIPVDAILRGDTSVNVVIRPGDVVVAAPAPRRDSFARGPWPSTTQQSRGGDALITALEFERNRLRLEQNKLLDSLGPKHASVLSVGKQLERVERELADAVARRDATSGTYYVSGVGKAGAYTVDAPITLLQALIAAQYDVSRGGGQHVLIVSNHAGSDEPRTRAIGVTDLMLAPGNAPEVRPGDLLIVRDGPATTRPIPPAGGVYYVGGEVEQPGAYTITSPISVLQAVIGARFDQQSGKDKFVTLMRRKGDAHEMRTWTVKELMANPNPPEHVMADDKIMISAKPPATQPATQPAP